MADYLRKAPIAASRTNPTFFIASYASSGAQEWNAIAVLQSVTKSDVTCFGGIECRTEHSLFVDVESDAELEDEIYFCVGGLQRRRVCDHFHRAESVDRVIWMRNFYAFKHVLSVIQFLDYVRGNPLV